MLASYDRRDLALFKPFVGVCGLVEHVMFDEATDVFAR